MTHTWRDLASNLSASLWRDLLSPSADIAKAQLWLVIKSATKGQREPSFEEVARAYLKLRDELHARALTVPEGHHPASPPPPPPALPMPFDLGGGLTLTARLAPAGEVVYVIGAVEAPTATLAAVRALAHVVSEALDAGDSDAAARTTERRDRLAGWIEQALDFEGAIT